MAWCVVSDVVHDFFPLSMKGKVPAAPLLASLVRLWAASLCKGGKTESLVSPPCCLEWGLMSRLIKCTLMVAKGKPSAITFYITYPELIMFCSAKSVGFSKSTIFSFTAVISKDISLISSLHLIDLLILMPEFTVVVQFPLSLSPSLVFGPSSSSLV